VTKMFELVFNFEEELDKRQKAADNMIVLTKERVGAELLFKEVVVQKIFDERGEESQDPSVPGESVWRPWQG
jgi:hypothetical protein